MTKHEKLPARPREWSPDTEEQFKVWLAEQVEWLEHERVIELCSGAPYSDALTNVEVWAGQIYLDGARFREIKAILGPLPTFETPTASAAIVESLRELLDWCKGRLAEDDKNADPMWSDARKPTDWREKLHMSPTAMKNHIDAGRLVIDKITTKLWRIRLDTLRKFTGSK